VLAIYIYGECLLLEAFGRSYKLVGAPMIVFMWVTWIIPYHIAFSLFQAQISSYGEAIKEYFTWSCNYLAVLLVVWTAFISIIVNMY
jgi:uncharacterized membrane protein